MNNPLSRLIELIHEGLRSMECKVRKGHYPTDHGDLCCGRCWTCIHVREVQTALSDLADEHAKSLSNSSSLALIKAMLDDKFVIRDK